VKYLLCLKKTFSVVTGQHVGEDIPVWAQPIGGSLVGGCTNHCTFYC